MAVGVAGCGFKGGKCVFAQRFADNPAPAFKIQRGALGPCLAGHRGHDATGQTSGDAGGPQKAHERAAADVAIAHSFGQSFVAFCAIHYFHS